MNAIARSDGLSTYLAQIERFPLLKPEEERALALRWYDQKDLEAAHRLVTSNLRFVVKVAFEYKAYAGRRMLDLIQEGNVGLMTAVRKFNPYRGYRLISYAVWWIRAYIRKFLMSTWSLVKVGTTAVQRKVFYSMGRLRGSDAEGHADDVHRIAEALGVEDARVLETEARLSYGDFSLDAEPNSEGRPMRDLLPSGSPNPEEALADREERGVQETRLRGALGTLAPRERLILERRLLAETPATLESIGRELGVTKERVRQIEARLLEKLRRAVTAPPAPPPSLLVPSAAVPA